MHENIFHCQLWHMGQMEIGKLAHEDQFVGDQTCHLMLTLIDVGRGKVNKNNFKLIKTINSCLDSDLN